MIKDFSGKVVGIFVIGSLNGVSGDGHSLWSSTCPHCGNSHIARITNFKTIKSCGCLTPHLLSEGSRKHGQKNTPEYAVWINMIARCHDPRDKSFHHYGGRGIIVCDLWRYSVLSFIADMGRRPSGSHQIDRVNNDLGYCKDNCRWATRIENGNNRRNNLVIEHEGRRQTLSQWAREKKLNPDTLGMRILRGWPPSKAISEPLRVR